MSTKPTLVMYNMSYYAKWEDGVVNRNFHIAKELIRSGAFSHVVHIDFLPYNFSSAIRSLKSIYAMDKKKLNSKLNYKGYRIFQLKDGSTLLAFTPMYLFYSQKRRKQFILKAIQSITKGDLISWSYNPFDLSFLDKKVFTKSIFDMVDDWRHHSAYTSNTKTLTKNYEIITKEASNLFVVSKYLKIRCKDEFRKKDATLIPNTSELVITGKPTIHANAVLYLGTIESRFDVELVEFLVNANPTKHFTFIGPVWKMQKNRFDALTRYKNVTYLGELVYATKVAALLSTFDVGIIPHHQSRFSQSNDPLKIYDYLRAGLPVVSTIPTSEDAIDEFVYLADSRQSFNKSLSKALDENTEVLVKKRKDTMQKITWEKRVSDMLTHARI